MKIRKLNEWEIDLIFEERKLEEKGFDKDEDDTFEINENNEIWWTPAGNTRSEGQIGNYRIGDEYQQTPLVKY